VQLFAEELNHEEDLPTLGSDQTDRSERRSPIVDLNTFIVAVFYEVDNWLAGQNKKLRRRGPEPTLSDSEVLTMEIVGEFLGIDDENGLYAYFRRHYAEWFPALWEVHRTTFTRQMANLWVAKERLWRELLGRIDFDPAISLVDSFPVPTCRFARAYRCRLLPEESAFGYDEMNKQTFYGLRAHLRLCWPGVNSRDEPRPGPDAHGPMPTGRCPRPFGG
jgi:hypothetical protein